VANARAANIADTQILRAQALQNKMDTYMLFSHFIHTGRTRQRVSAQPGAKTDLGSI
jgi:hypothetical protein